MQQLLIITFLFCVGVCRGQSPILPINDANYPEATGAYYKDLNNDLNRYVGTWKYTNGTTSLTVTLQKKVMQHIINAPYGYYEDLVIGEYKYILNGVEKINTLPLLTSITNPQANSIKSFIAVTTGDIRL
ncbi:hypothetical protein FMM05_14220 [Flavobacterium zepuense]|uniref:DUF6705 domain-containing protein n=1 Tax=Flavobacterium zepuense TaxID=2593302 RepID=A0A552UYM6_9FLAO|nr:DUF6705 family protein [Flavobacterium zepuense]TRW23345.1 hypothetical protein FMM05_14220 [Flavobacterium zepuense]